MTITRVVGLWAVVTLLVAACGAATTATPARSADPLESVTVDNGTDARVSILYEAPDGGTEPLAELEPGQQVLIDWIFDGHDGLCRTGRLVAQADGAEIDELYLVCKDRTWTIEVS